MIRTCRDPLDPLGPAAASPAPSESEISDASALGVSVSALRSSRAVAAALTGLGDYVIGPPISYEDIEGAYNAAFEMHGREPRLCRVHPSTYSEIQSYFQTRQRLAVSPSIGTTGLRWNSAIIIRDPAIPTNVIRFSE